MNVLRCLVCLLLAFGLCACETVEPWERGALARREMQWAPDAMEISLQAQINASKEASSGGMGAAGGGCGCN
jgi:hypothetical protein